MTAVTESGVATDALRHRGDFSLSRSVRSAGRAVFVDSGQHDGLELAFRLDGSWLPVAVRIEQPDDLGTVRSRVLANPEGADASEIRANLRRILSLAPDGRGLSEVADRDEVAAGLVERFRGLRPIAYPSPYEAAARTIIGHRLPIARAAAIVADLVRSKGTALDLEGGLGFAFPAPDVLRRVSSVHGLSDRKVGQLQALGQEAEDGWLTAERLRTVQRDRAMEQLQQLPGVGPFSAELIMIRGAGDPDVFARTEARLHGAMAEFYGLAGDPDVDALQERAEAWRPYRSWISVMFRDATKDGSTGSADR